MSFMSSESESESDIFFLNFLYPNRMLLVGKFIGVLSLRSGSTKSVMILKTRLRNSHSM